MNANLPKVFLGSDQNICKGTEATVGAAVFEMHAPVKYYWFVNKQRDTNFTTSTLYFSKLDTTKTIRVEAEDSLGCIVRDTTTLTALALPKVGWNSSDTSLCWSPTELNLNSLIKSPNPSAFTHSNVNIRGVLNQYGAAGLVDTSQAPTYFLNIGKINNALDLQEGKSIKETLTLWYKDSNGCENTAQSFFTINGTPIVELQDRTLCQNAGTSVFLDSLVIQPKASLSSTREWNLISGPKINGILSTKNYNYLFTAGSSPDNSYSGNYNLQFCVTDQSTSCKACDTNTITVLPQFAVEALKFTPICEGSDSINLSSYFLTNGTFGDTGDSSYTIVSRNGNTDPKTWANGSLTNGCIIPPTMPFGKWVVSFSPKSNKSFCSQSIEQLFEILPRPKAQFTTIPADSVGKDLPIFKTQNTSKISDNSKLSYQWYFDYPDLNNQSSAIAPDITYLANDARYTVWLIASSDKGCADTAIKTLKVGNPVNGIASISLAQFRINPQFVVSGIAFTEIETEVYDAAGKLLARSINNTPIALPPGIYLYKLSLKFGDTADILHLSGKVFVE
jgi:hypothetical protein